MDSETFEQLQARHRKEQKDLQGRITNKKKNATKKTRKGVNEECAELERQMKERQEGEIRTLNGEPNAEPNGDVEGEAEDTKVSAEMDQQEESTNGLASRIQEVKISDTESSSNGTQQQPKKRNRQKERLARRAAEQEAASEAAAAEAANMPDQRDIEAKAMQAVITENGLKQKEIAPDGHCLFAAVADQLGCHGMEVRKPSGLEDVAGLEAQEPAYKTVRRMAAEYMTRHADDFAGFLDEPLEKHVAEIRDTAEWGGMLELSALANAYNVEIHVIQNGRTEVISPSSGADDAQTIWLAYYRHGYGLGEHYNSLRPAKKDAS